jgi:hypothetical protein
MTTEHELIPMSQRELHRYHTLRLVLEGHITGAQGATSLGLSERHVYLGTLPISSTSAPGNTGGLSWFAPQGHPSSRTQRLAGIR